MKGRSIGSALRRAPLQKRSKAKVQSILAAAEKLLNGQGYDAVIQSPATLIEMSGVTTGVFYNYFDNGEAVLEALSISYFNEAVAVIDDIAERHYADWRSVIDVVVDNFAAFYRRRSVRELWLNHRTARLPGSSANVYIHKMISETIERTSSNRIRFTEAGAIVVAELGDRLLRLAFEQSEQGDPQLIAEAKAAMISYCGNFNCC